MHQKGPDTKMGEEKWGDRERRPLVSCKICRVKTSKNIKYDVIPTTGMLREQWHPQHRFFFQLLKVGSYFGRSHFVNPDRCVYQFSSYALALIMRGRWGSPGWEAAPREQGYGAQETLVQGPAATPRAEGADWVLSLGKFGGWGRVESAELRKATVVASSPPSLGWPRF